MRASIALAMTAVAVSVVAAAGPAAAAVPQPPAQRTGRTAAGVPFALNGRMLRITVPASTRRGRRIRVSCGRLTTADLRPGVSAGSVTGHGSRVFRGRRRLQIRLGRDVSAIAEWCEFATLPSGRSGAAMLKPRLAPAPAPLVSGPGVREAIAEGGRARFLLDGTTLTLIAARPLRGDVVLFLACYATNPTVVMQPTVARSVAIGSGRRTVTVDLGVDIEAAASTCFVESSREGDLFLAYFGTPPAKG
jgi:hypothetical protein